MGDVLSDTSQLGQSGVKVPAICFGTSGLGDMPGTYGYSVDEQRARETLHAIFDSDFAFLDSSRNYGMGRSEQRLGQALKDYGRRPSGLIISTKLDRDMESLVFDAGQARRSLEQSLSALGLDKVDILHLHDPEHCASLQQITCAGGAIDELFKIKEEGLADAVGLAAGRVDIMMPILQNWPFDVMITHNRHTLINSNAEKMIELAVKRGISVINAAPYHGGALAKGAASCKRLAYQQADTEMLAPVKAVEEICARHDIPPGAAALQFSLRDPRVISTICGATRPERVAQTLQWAGLPISDAAWQELDAISRSGEDLEATRVYDPG